MSELLLGLWKIGPISGARLAGVQEFCTLLHVKPLDLDDALLAGKIYGDMLRGKEIGWRDPFIAAIVLNNGKKILASTPRHFQRVPDIEVMDFA